MSLISRAKKKYRREGLISLIRSGLSPSVIRNVFLNLFQSTKTVKEEQHEIFEQDYDLNSYINQGTDETSYWIESTFFQQSKHGVDSSVLELGCNIGRHLNAFHTRGYNDLTGVDINQDVYDEMENLYPELADDLQFHQGPFESVLPEINREFDCVYSVAVLMHVSNDESQIFDEIAEICNEVLITIEAEKRLTHPKQKFVVYRNYKEVFESRGLSQVFEYEFNYDNRILGDNLDDRYIARVFKK